MLKSDAVNRRTAIGALVRKELRELAPIAVIVAIVQLGLLVSACGLPARLIGRDRLLSQSHSIPFINDMTLIWMLVVAANLAIALGFWQTAWEWSRGTWPFLLQRAVSRSSIFATKLVVGGSVVLLASILPWLLYAVWAATPGTHGSPFYWSMTASALKFSLVTPLLYLGAFYSGLRPARWWASRVFPLMAGAGLIGMLELVAQLWGGIVLFAVAACAATATLVAAILAEALTGDFS